MDGNSTSASPDTVGESAPVVPYPVAADVNIVSKRAEALDRILAGFDDGGLIEQGIFVPRLNELSTAPKRVYEQMLYTLRGNLRDLW